MVNLENDTIEIAEVIKQFREIGQETLIDKLKQSLLPFDRYIIKYFYEGIC